MEEEKKNEIDMDVMDVNAREEEAPEAADNTAGFNERFLAYLIDTLPFVFLAYYTFVMMLKYNVLQYSSSAELKWKAVWIIVFITYETVFSSGGRATLGKYLLGIRVRDKNGEELSLVKSFLRVVGYFLSSLTINFGYLMALFTPQKKALHDYLAGSRVIRVRGKGDFAEGFILVASWSLLAFFVGSWIQRTWLTFTPVEQKQIFTARRTLSKIAKLEEIHSRKYGFYTNDIRKLAELTKNIPAVRAELAKNLAPDSLEIATNGRDYVVSGKARNWRKTRIEFSSLAARQREEQKQKAGE
ncbi:MAG: hypothetical protein COT17_07445 [Elusimicrobia bacterium CG08_land_8_20_14_0_20_51_18]|nr:MAG: hypothetical protein COT17_07445 [Elusimicrobia bacterium CG08_land_8_20_14_0_20_51_18]